MARDYCARFRAVGRRVGDRLWRPYAGGGVPTENRSWTLVARSRRRGVDNLRRSLSHSAVDRRVGSDLVVRRVRVDIRDRALDPVIPTEGSAKAAVGRRCRSRRGLSHVALSSARSPVHPYETSFLRPMSLIGPPRLK